MKVLVTGCNGYLGSYICERLISLNYEVCGIDLVGKQNPKVEQITGDFSQNDMFKTKILDADWIIHLAAVSGVSSGEKNPEICVDVNINKLSILLNYIRTHNSCVRFSFISTYDLYDEKHESLIDIGAMSSVYHYSKYCGEILCELFKNRYNLDIDIIRPSILFGSNDFSGPRVLDVFIRAALAGEPLRVSNPDQSLTFTCIEDIGSVLLARVHNDKKNNSLTPKNLVSPETYSLLELAQLIKLKLNSESQIFCRQKIINQRFVEKKKIPEILVSNIDTTVSLVDWLGTIG